MKKFPKDLFTKVKTKGPGKTIAFHARPDLVNSIEKEFKASEEKSLSSFLSTLMEWALEDRKEKKKAG
jgi:hypothetical protein